MRAPANYPRQPAANPLAVMHLSRGTHPTGWPMSSEHRGVDEELDQQEIGNAISDVHRLPHLRSRHATPPARLSRLASTLKKDFSFLKN